MSANEQSERNRPQSGKRVAVVRHASDERRFHLSDVLEQIRDDGPAVSAGIVLAPAESQRNPTAAAANDAKVPAVAEPPAPAMQASIHHRLLPVACFLLAVSLACSVGYSFWLQTRIAGVESRLQDIANEQQAWRTRL